MQAAAPMRAELGSIKAELEKKAVDFDELKARRASDMTAAQVR